MDCDAGGEPARQPRNVLRRKGEFEQRDLSLGGLSSSPLTYPIDKAERSDTKFYPASSVNREIIHQINRKQTMTVDASKAALVSRSLAIPSVGRATRTEWNQAWRDRQSWQRRISPPIAQKTRSNPPLR